MLSLGAKGPFLFSPPKGLFASRWPLRVTFCRLIHVGHWSGHGQEWLRGGTVTGLQEVMPSSVAPLSTHFSVPHVD